MSLSLAVLRSRPGHGRGRHLVERAFMLYRRNWVVVVSGFFEPLFYLLSIGVGVGKLVGDVAGPTGEPLSYRAYIAPALMASSAFNGAVYESTMNVYFRLHYEKVYAAVLATPMRVRDVVVGEISFALLRGLVYSVAFMIVMAAMGLVESWWALVAVPACSLIGFAFAATGFAATSFMRTWEDFEFVTMTQLVLFLFSATFYPLSVYPRWMEIAVQCTPLYHGVHLTRALVVGDVGPGLLPSVAYLAILGVMALRLADRRLVRILTP